mmetsp:Transcript_89574/g.252460  ORF Transcript_89574/g.252460 Transcript_89574/m.252460 type:complete len:238 (+) Transcript_89574:791-1504(+)
MGMANHVRTLQSDWWTRMRPTLCGQSSARSRSDPVLSSTPETTSCRWNEGWSRRRVNNTRPISPSSKRRWCDVRPTSRLSSGSTGTKSENCRSSWLPRKRSFTRAPLAQSSWRPPNPRRQHLWRPPRPRRQPPCKLPRPAPPLMHMTLQRRRRPPKRTCSSYMNTRGSSPRRLNSLTGIDKLLTCTGRKPPRALRHTRWLRRWPIRTTRPCASTRRSCVRWCSRTRMIWLGTGPSRS